MTDTKHDPRDHKQPVPQGLAAEDENAGRTHRQSDGQLPAGPAQIRYPAPPVPEQQCPVSEQPKQQEDDDELPF